MRCPSFLFVMLCSNQNLNALILHGFYHFAVTASGDVLCDTALHYNRIPPHTETILRDSFPVAYRAETTFFVKSEVCLSIRK